MKTSRNPSHLHLFSGCQVKLEFRTYALDWRAEKIRGGDVRFVSTPWKRDKSDDVVTDIDELRELFLDVRTAADALEFLKKTNCMWESHEGRNPWGTVLFSEFRKLQTLIGIVSRSSRSEWRNLDSQFPRAWLQELHLPVMVTMPPPTEGQPPFLIIGRQDLYDPSLPIAMGILIQIERLEGKKYRVCRNPHCKRLFPVTGRERRGKIYHSEGCGRNDRMRRLRASSSAARKLGELNNEQEC